MKTLLLGDLSPTEKSNPLFEAGDLNTLFTDTLPVFRGNDFSFVNLECALTDCENSIEKFGPPLKATKKVAEVLRSLDITCAGLSNNHVFDFGKAGIKDTFEALEGAGIAYTGFGENYGDSRQNFYFKSGNETICIVAVCEHEYSYALPDRMGSRPYDPYDTMADIRRGKENADRVIAVYHGGKEHCEYPSPRLYRLCHAMADNGADLVLCQHSHCIGCYEKYNDCHIVYGQGNFHFICDSEFQSWIYALMVRYDTVTNEIEFIPTVNTEVGIRLAVGSEKAEIMSGFELRNAMLQNGRWKQGWHEFCESVSERYLRAISNAYTENATNHSNQLFAHYFDCEAHHDVWAELCKTANETNEK